MGLGLPLPRGRQWSPGILPSGVPWALPASPGMGLSHPGCFLCALKTIFALSGVRKKYSDMVEKDIYIPWWAVRGRVNSEWGVTSSSVREDVGKKPREEAQL